MTGFACPFCRDLNSNVGGGNIIIARHGELAVLADLAPISQGHLLICPVEHITSFANAPADLRHAAFSIARDLVAGFKSQGIPTLISEHGTGERGGPSNACCDHAHLHVLPLPQGVELRLFADAYAARGGPPAEARGDDELDAFARAPYNLLCLDGQSLLLWDNVLNFFPQFFRSVACQVLGYSQGDRRYLWQTSIDKLAAVRGVNASVNSLRQWGARPIREYRQINKLVRDGIPELLVHKNETPVFRQVAGNELRDALLNKVGEELAEFNASPSTNEAGDILEAVDALIAAHGLSAEDVDRARKAKQTELGAFEQRRLLELVIAWGS